jgi:uncharacterized RDD family membrane protein YckC
VLDQTELGEQDAGELDVALEPQVAPSSRNEPEEEKPAPKSPQPHGLSPWQIELAERVQEYRQRRAHLQKGEGEPKQPPGFDFGPPAPNPEETRPHVIEFPSAEESASRPKLKPIMRAAPPSFGMRSFESAFKEEGEVVDPPKPPKSPSPEETAPLEIELGSSGSSSLGPEKGDASTVPIAQMNMRFFAGLIDALVLLSGAALYVLISWQVISSLSLGPLGLMVGSLVFGFFIMLYFAGCTAMASATPGLIWAGLEVITFEGNPPTSSDSLWRGFGYLVSMSALMLGFVWAVVDAEGLTWHDRMSRTFIVPSQHPY